MFWTTTAYAMGGGAAGAEGAAGGFQAFIPLILMFAVFYFLLIRPQQKRAKEHRAMLSTLKRGDEVVTMSGLFGRILEVADDYVVLDLGDTKVKMSRSAVSTVIGSSKTVEKKTKRSESKEEKKEGSSDSSEEK